MAPLIRQAAAAGVAVTAVLSARAPQDLMQDELLRWMFDPHCRQPVPVSQGQGARPVINSLMAKQKSLKMRPRLAQHADRCRARPHQVAHRLMHRVRRPEPP